MGKGRAPAGSEMHLAVDYRLLGKLEMGRLGGKVGGRAVARRGQVGWYCKGLRAVTNEGMPVPLFAGG